MVVAALAGTALVGCGEIIEVPVAMTSQTGQTDEGTSGPESTEDSSSSTGLGSTGSTTKAPDIDDASSSGATDETSSSTGGRPTESVAFCLEVDDVIDLPEDGSWQEWTVEVEPRDGVVSLGINLRITHPRVSDLQIRLRSPAGSTIELLTNPTCSGAHVDATFEDRAEELGNEQCLTDIAAIMGSVKALDEMDLLLGDPVGGTWTLLVTDTEPEQSGSLDDVCVVLVVEDE